MQNGAVCITPPLNWCDSSAPLHDRLRITARKQALPYPPLANVLVHKKILRQQKNCLFHPQIQVQNEHRQLRDTPFVGYKKFSQFIGIVLLPSKQKLSVAFISDLLRDFWMVLGRSQMDESLSNEIIVWKMMRDGLDSFPSKMRYAADIVLSC